VKAVVVREPGGPDVLELREVPEPVVAADHVGVRVAWAGVNRADLLQRMGLYPAPAGAPADILGLEIAGVVDELGSQAGRHAIGDPVYGLVRGGGYAERVVMHEAEAAPVPEGLALSDAAAIPEAFLTAYDALVIRGRLAVGERVLIHAVGSGVGTVAVQIARALDCHVIGTSRTADKLERAKALGLDDGICTEQGPKSFVEPVLRATGGAGVDVVLDLVGGAYVSEDLAACAPRARIVVVGLVGGARAELSLGLLLTRRAEVIGTVMRSRPLDERIAAARLLSGPIRAWISRRRIRPVVDRRWALADAGEAHAYVESEKSFGKALLACADASSVVALGCDDRSD
jgi:NADPH:quinone reductase